MPNTLVLVPAADAPCGLIATSSGGSGGSTQAVSLLLVAWDDPEEKDINLARFMNRLESGQQFLTPLYSYSRYNNLTYRSGGASDDTITLSWTPPRRLPHHYAVYIQTAAAAWSSTVLGNKIIPASGTVNGNIPPTATTASFANITSRTYNFIANGEYGSEDIVNHYLYVSGNLVGLIDPSPGTAILEYPGGTSRTCTAAKLRYTEFGEQTRLTLSAGPNSGQYAATINGGVIYANVSGQDFRQEVALSIMQGIDHSPRDTVMLDYAGRPVNRSLLTSALDDMLTLHVPYTGISLSDSLAAITDNDGAGGIYILNKWRKYGLTLELYVSPTSDTATGIDRWRGYAVDVNDYQLPDISDFDELTIMFKPIFQYSSFYDYGYRDITSINTGSKTWTISGPYTESMAAGKRFWVSGSTDNDGYYVISSVSTGVNSQVLTSTTAPTSTTADGLVVFDPAL